MTLNEFQYSTPLAEWLREVLRVGWAYLDVRIQTTIDDAGALKHPLDSRAIPYLQEQVMGGLNLERAWRHVDAGSPGNGWVDLRTDWHGLATGALRAMGEAVPCQSWVDPRETLGELLALEMVRRADRVESEAEHGPEIHDVNFVVRAIHAMKSITGAPPRGMALEAALDVKRCLCNLNPDGLLEVYAWPTLGIA